MIFFNFTRRPAILCLRQAHRPPDGRTRTASPGSPRSRTRYFLRLVVRQPHPHRPAPFCGIAAMPEETTAPPAGRCWPGGRISGFQGERRPTVYLGDAGEAVEAVRETPDRRQGRIRHAGEPARDVRLGDVDGSFGEEGQNFRRKWPGKPRMFRASNCGYRATEWRGGRRRRNPRQARACSVARAAGSPPPAPERRRSRTGSHKIASTATMIFFPRFCKGSGPGLSAICLSSTWLFCWGCYRPWD